MQIEKDTLIYECNNQNLEYTGERYIPEETSEEMTIEHMQRYLFAREFVKDRIILDVACGEGYGSHILNEEAYKVYAIDIDDKVINEAKKKYRADNIKFSQASIEKLPYEDKMFDTIVSFETIEHVKENVQKNFLKEVNRVLKNDGIFIISTPNKRIYSDKVEFKNPYHQKEFYKKEFLDFLSQTFEYTYIFNQYFGVGYFIKQEGKGTALKLDAINGEDARYYVVICSHHELQINISKSYDIFNNSMYFYLFKNCNKLDKEIIKINNDFKEFRYNSNKYMNHIEMDIRGLKKLLSDKHKDIEELKEVLAHRDRDIEELREVLAHRDKDIEELKGVLAHRNRDIEELRGVLAHRDRNIEELREVVANRDKDIEELKLILDVMKNKNNALIERIVHPIKNIIYKMQNKK